MSTKEPERTQRYLTGSFNRKTLHPIRKDLQDIRQTVKLFVYFQSFSLEQKTNDKFNTTGLQSIFLAKGKVFLDVLKTLGSWGNFIPFGFNSATINLECKKSLGKLENYIGSRDEHQSKGFCWQLVKLKEAHDRMGMGELRNEYVVVLEEMK